MKKIFLAATLGVFTLAACKKDRTCTCSITQVSRTDNGVTQPVLGAPITDKKKLTKVSKTGAHCNSFTEVDTKTDSKGHRIIDTYKADCTLE